VLHEVLHYVTLGHCYQLLLVVEGNVSKAIIQPRSTSGGNGNTSASCFQTATLTS